jgi:hypothetical protein
VLLSLAVHDKFKAKRLVVVAMLAEQLTHNPKFKGLNPDAIDSEKIAQGRKQ